MCPKNNLSGVKRWAKCILHRFAIATSAILGPTLILARNKAIKMFRIRIPISVTNLDTKIGLPQKTLYSAPVVSLTSCKVNRC